MLEKKPLCYPDSFNNLLELYGSDATFKRILQLVFCQNCCTLIVEHDFQDEYYQSEYDYFYERIHRKPCATTTRLHFFSEKITEESLSNIEQYNKNYLGFCILRPFQHQRVVFAIIKPLEDTTKNKKIYILCQSTIKVFLAGKSLNIKGFPFIQQDGQLGVCAHVALAMVDRYLSETNNKKYMKIPEIVECISKIPTLGRTIPSPGLSAIHISNAFKEMGYEPLIYVYENDSNRLNLFSPERVIYHYIESGLPIILGIPTKTSGHALTVIGHSFEPDMWWAFAEKPYYFSKPSGRDYHCSTTWIQNFIINDDNFGPYLSVPKEYLWAVAQESLLIAVPLPKNIFVQGEDAEVFAKKFIDIIISNEAIINIIDDDSKKWMDS